MKTGNKYSNDLLLSQELLRNVFGDIETTGLDYLKWLYHDNPSGEKIQANLDDEDGRVGHYVVVPQSYSYELQPIKVALSLNTAVAPRGRGKGLFTKLAREVINSLHDLQYDGILGVANDNSTPGFIRKLGFELVQPLPVKLGLLRKKHNSTIQEGKAAMQHILAIDAKAAVKSNKLSVNISQSVLEWRLSKINATYHIYANEEAGIIVSQTMQAGKRFIVVLATFASEGVVDVSFLIKHAANKLNTSAYVYSGWNDNSKLAGLPVLKKFRPSPLNLVWKPISGQIKDIQKNHIRRFEFLDFDAY